MTPDVYRSDFASLVILFFLPIAGGCGRISSAPKQESNCYQGNYSEDCAANTKVQVEDEIATVYQMQFSKRACCTWGSINDSQEL